MVLHRRFRDPHQLGDLAQRPLKAVHQDHGVALSGGERRQGPGQFGLDVRRRVVWHLDELRTGWSVSTTQVATNDVEVAHRVVHLAEPLPMLPPVCQGLDCCLPPDLSAASGDEGVTEPCFIRSCELGERIDMRLLDHHWCASVLSPIWAPYGPDVPHTHLVMTENGQIRATRPSGTDK